MAKGPETMPETARAESRLGSEDTSRTAKLRRRQTEVEPGATTAPVVFWEEVERERGGPAGSKDVRTKRSAPVVHEERPLGNLSEGDASNR